MQSKQAMSDKTATTRQSGEDRTRRRNLNATVAVDTLPTATVASEMLPGALKAHKVEQGAKPGTLTRW